mmetsp:Transcript_23372/g.60998  ORF Transcript_23372/g.60998 Transcript_23372/m.60998 type:complete len:209 (+) Transcript_23372:217-843(+)
MGFCCIGRRRRRAKEGEAAEAATRAWCQEAVNPKVPQTPAASRALETQTPLHARAVVRPSPLEVELHHHSAAARRVVGLDAARRRHAAAVPAAGPAQPSITPAARRTVDLDAAAAFAATPPPPRMRTPLADANGPVPSGKRRPYRGLSTPALVADLERTLGTRLRPRHATVQKARRGNGDGYEGWLRRHFASPPRRRSKTPPPPKVWI